MRISGKLVYDPNDTIPYYVSIPELNIQSQGMNLEDAYEMIKDAMGLLLEVYTNGAVTKKDLRIIPTSAETFDVTTDKILEISGFALHRLRMRNEISQE